MNMNEGDDIPAHMSAGYRRALWTVVMLNVGYGALEMVGGFLVGSQALKADSLDFVGDGLITLLGLLAIGWSLMWRARAALIQGLFLGVLGIAVIVNTIYELSTHQEPEALMMGVLGLVALAVNVAAAAVLMPHRAGDANVRGGVVVLTERRSRQPGGRHRGGARCFNRYGLAGPCRRRCHRVAVPAIIGFNCTGRTARHVGPPFIRNASSTD